MNVTLRQMRALLAVARMGSFTQAAESLFITQSALSGLIKEMETALGVRLVDRSTRKVQLTSAGATMVPGLEKILGDLELLLGRVIELKDLKTGLVRVAAPQLMAATMFPGLIAAYGAAHPHIRVRLVDCPVEDVMSRVSSGEVDLGVGPERAPHPDVVSTPLFSAPFVAVMPPGHALARAPQVRWADLTQYPMIALEGPFIDQLVLDLRAAADDVQLHPVHKVAYMPTALAMSHAGLGVAICVPYADSLIRLYGLEMRPLIKPEIRRGFAAFTPRGRSLSPAAQSFLSFVGPRIRAMPFQE